MREFLYKNSFFRYISNVCFKPPKISEAIGAFVCLYIFNLYCIIGGIVSFNSASIVIGGLGGIMFVTALVVGACRRNKPNMIYLMPISSKRKCLYDVISVLLYCVVSVILAIIFVLLFIAFVATILVIFQASTEVTNTEETVVNEMGVYGGIFAACHCIILFSAGMIGSYTKTTWNRNAFISFFILAFSVAMILTSVPYAKTLLTPEMIENRELPDLIYPMVDACWQPMKYPWIGISIWCVITVVMVIMVFVMGFRYHKPSKL